MKKTIPISLFFTILNLASMQANNQPDRNEVRLGAKAANNPDLTRQAFLRNSETWQNFIGTNGAWFVEFDETSGMPNRAYGKPISIPGTTLQDKANYFIENQLNAFGVDKLSLSNQAEVKGKKYHYINFKQTYQGLEVIGAKVVCKFSATNQLVQFTANTQNLNINTTPVISETDAISAASNLLGVVDISTAINGLAILPIVKFGTYQNHLVYSINAKGTNQENIPVNYLTYIDAETGSILMRTNLVLFHDSKSDAVKSDENLPLAIQVNTQASIYPNGPNDGALSLSGMPYAKVTISGTDYYTDVNGDLTLALSGPLEAELPVEGKYARVVNLSNGITPSVLATLNEGVNNVNYNSDAILEERCAYRNTNIIHEHLKTVFPDFTGCDFPLTVNVETQEQTCNAFYDGSSLNFFQEISDCYSLAVVADVVYHEYGHNINDLYYQSFGSYFINGGMNEGYADVWAFSVYNDPILADGYIPGNSEDYIRRYDEDPKVYPQDLIGEVHADGEIIAGAWWDTYLNLESNMGATMELYAEAFNGAQAEEFDGNEGIAFRNVLLDVLQADDDDADITNGTPNDLAILDAFLEHGISLISNATILHNQVLSATGGELIDINASLTLTFPWSSYLDNIALNYKINTESEYFSVNLANNGDDTYLGQIPEQENGTLISYYLGAQDIFGQVSNILPIGALLPDPNLPYYILVGFDLLGTSDFDENEDFGEWQGGLSTDNNTTGTWELDIPIGSFDDNNNEVAPDNQHTPFGELCYFTGNAGSINSGLGENDVDDGTTTLLSPIYDLSNLQNPAITYYRWYTNNPTSGANPNADWWQMYITNDGIDWVKVEETKTSDASWRRFSFRVADYISLSNNVQIKFNVSDSIRAGEYLDGGSLVEGALDDISIWEQAAAVALQENANQSMFTLFPIPARNSITINATIKKGNQYTISIKDFLGNLVFNNKFECNNKNIEKTLDISLLALGSYYVTIETEDIKITKKLIVIR